MARALPSLAVIGMIDAMAARFALVERLESMHPAATASKAHSDGEEPSQAQPHVVSTTQRFVLRTETSFLSTVLAPMGETLVVLLLLAPMDASKAVLMLLLATRLARKEESALVLMVLPQRLSLVEEASVLILSLMVEETAMVLLLEESSMPLQILSR
jgi:hypothetical protein